jgi:hypothetical protein
MALIFNSTSFAPNSHATVQAMGNRRPAIFISRIVFLALNSCYVKLWPKGRMELSGQLRSLMFIIISLAFKKA